MGAERRFNPDDAVTVVVVVVAAVAVATITRQRPGIDRNLDTVQAHPPPPTPPPPLPPPPPNSRFYARSNVSDAADAEGANVNSLEVGRRKGAAGEGYGHHSEG